MTNRLNGIMHFSPAGLAVTSDEALQAILEDLETWRQNLPEELQFRGPESGRHAGTSRRSP